MKERNPVRVTDLLRMKAEGRRIAVVTAYDYPTAVLADQAGADVILVGDSLGMVVLGHETTVTVTMNDMIRHTQAVVRAKPAALVVADLPFLSYATVDSALRNAGRLIQEGGASAVKLEGGESMLPQIARIVAAGVPVMGHLGMTPQSVHALGGWRLQAREPEQARRLLADARAMETAGAFGLVLEMIPSQAAEAVTGALAIPTIGIGAGPHCDGQVQVLHDLLGLFDRFKPRHARRYADIGAAIRAALAEYVADVREGRFPGEAETTSSARLAEDDAWRS